MPSDRKQISRALLASSVAGLVALGSLSGCVSVQAIEPVINPPSQFQMDATVPIEFVAPLAVGLRCAERGAKFLGLPGLNSGACSDRTLMTFPDPCFTLTAGWYADVLCREISEVRAVAAAQAVEAEKTYASIRIAQQNTSFVHDGTAPWLVHADLRHGAPGARPLPISQASPTRKSSAQKPVVMASEAPRRRLEENQPLRVEFVASDQVMMRCAERGAKFLAGSDTGACADKHLLTIANPCSTPNTGWYGRTLCHEMAHANGWPADHRGGAWLKRLPPILPASESPEAKAYASRMLAAASLMASRSPVLVDAQAEQAGLPASGADRPLADASADTVPATAPVREPLDADQFAQPSIEALVRPLADFIALDLAREKSEASGVAGLPDDRLAADRSSDGGPVLTALAHPANDVPPQQFALRHGFLDLWLKAQTGLPMKRGEELARENTSLVAYAPGFRDGVSPDATGGR